MIVGLNNRVCVQLLLHQLLLCLPQPTKPLSWSSSRRHHIATAVGRRRPDMPTILFDPVCRSAVENPSSSNDETNNNKMDWLSIPEALERRHACKAFARYDGQESTDDDDVQVDTASPADPWIVQQAAACLDLARLSPSAFNTQPYKVVLVHDVAQKTALSKACLGPNARRVLDADCTAVFLADKQVLRTVLPQTQWRRRRRQQQQSSAALAQRQKSRTGPPTSKTTLLYITLFSSGYPLPRWLSAAISFLVRTAMSWFDAIARAIFRYPLPTLSNAETWATKQTSLVAMTYMLAAAAKGLATIPMEGLNAAVVRRVVGARGARYAVPLVVATGRRAAAKKATNSSRKNGGGGGQVQTRRYPAQQVLFGNSLQEPLMLKRNDDDDDDVAVGRTTTAEDDDETGSAGGGGSSDGAAAADAK